MATFKLQPERRHPVTEGSRYLEELDIFFDESSVFSHSGSPCKDVRMDIRAFTMAKIGSTLSNPFSRVAKERKWTLLDLWQTRFWKIDVDEVHR